MTERSFRARVLAREPLLGAFLTWPTEGVLELLALAGFDFAVVDTEHGYFNPESVERMVRAAEGAPLPVIVRVPSCLAAADTGRALDAGACGVLFPRAESDATVRAALESVKYAPVGKRGLAGVRANRYGGVPFDHWVIEANEGSTVFVQIETAGALNALERSRRRSGSTSSSSARTTSHRPSAFPVTTRSPATAPPSSASAPPPASTARPPASCCGRPTRSPRSPRRGTTSSRPATGPSSRSRRGPGARR